MFFLIGILVQYILMIFVPLFIIWFSLTGILYQNNQCTTIQFQTSNYSNKNISLNSSLIDSRLKLNHFTILGTHNSYHKANLFSKYEHPSLDQQLQTKIRQIELDIHLMQNNHLVYHLQLFDDKTNCYCFNECLLKIANWSQNNPSHYPIYLFIEIKQMFYEDFITGLTGVKCEHFQQIKDQILQVFSSDTFILPDQIQGNQTSIRDALKKQRGNELSEDYTYRYYGWPPVYQSLGKLIPVFIDDVYNLAVNLYSKCVPLRTFFFIAQTHVDLPYSSIISISNSIKDEQILYKSAINGQIIRILLGYGSKNLYETYQTVKQYGIHIISSDSVDCNDTQLCQTLAKEFQDSTILCNNYFASSFCNPSIPFL